MQVKVNGNLRQFEDGVALSELLASAVQRKDGLAVAVNRSVVPKSRWEKHVLQDGDQVEIIQAVGGG